jgi:TonB-linked SusC/RagA family outer membrane protein
LFDLYTDLHKTFGKHDLSALAGFSQEYETYGYFNGIRDDLITTSYPTLQLATGEMSVSEDKQAWVIRSAFYRLNYIFDGKYIIGTNGRYDGTSRFPKQTRFGFFPSGEAAWIVSNERFFQPLSSIFSHAKLRATYGSLGNQAVGNYPYISTMSAGIQNVLVNGVKPMGVNPPGLITAALTWEKVYSLNGGIDVNFLNDRLAVSADVYRRDTKDMLAQGKTLPNVLGTSEPQINAADLKTKGWELSLLWRDRLNVTDKPFEYSARFILADSRTFITKFDNPTNYRLNYYVGQEIGEIWGLETLGFFKDQADIDNSPDQLEVTSYPGTRPIEAGDLKYRDLNGDGKITYGDRTLDNPGDFKIIGNSSNRYTYGLDLNADWNNFDLRIFVQGVGKKNWYHVAGDMDFYGMMDSPYVPVLKNNLDHWTPENTDAYFPRLKPYLANGAGDISIPQTRYLQNAAYMRMKNITFGYTLPHRLLSSIKVDGVRLYFSGENLFETTKLIKNFDPEQLNTQSRRYPIQRTYSIALNITL